MMLGYMNINMKKRPEKNIFEGHVMRAHWYKGPEWLADFFFLLFQSHSQEE